MPNCFFCGYYCLDHTREDCPTCGTYYNEEQLEEMQKIARYDLIPGCPPLSPSPSVVLEVVTIH